MRTPPAGVATAREWETTHNRCKGGREGGTGWGGGCNRDSQPVPMVGNRASSSGAAVHAQYSRRRHYLLRHGPMREKKTTADDGWVRRATARGRRDDTVDVRTRLSHTPIPPTLYLELAANPVSVSPPPQRPTPDSAPHEHWDGMGIARAHITALFEIVSTW